MKSFFSSSIIALLRVGVMNRARAASTLLSFVGFLLILGSVIAIPRPEVERFYFGHQKVWADSAFSLEPNSIKRFLLDTGSTNGTVISTHVETNGNLTYKIYEEGYLDERRLQFEWIIANSSVAGSSKDLFWTYTRVGFVLLVFENNNSFFVNAYITVKEYCPWYSEWIGVTHYYSLLNPVLIFPGIAAVSAGFVMGYAYRIRKVGLKDLNRRRLWASALIGLVAVGLVLGSATTIAYTANEWVEDTHAKVWADETFTLEPNATKTFTIDDAVANSSIIGIYINETTGTVYFDFVEGKDVFCKVFTSGMTNSTVLPTHPRFWTYPWQSGTWNIVFRNTNPVAINVSLTIVEHFYRMLMLKEVTHHVHVLSSLFAYPGIIMIAAAAVLMPEDKKDTENINTLEIPQYD